MNFRTLIRRSLRFHWRSHLGVVLGAAIGSAALIGALVVGDSVRQSLQWQAMGRLAGISAALDSGDRFFGADLLKRMLKLGAAQAQPSWATPTNSTPVWGHGFTEVDSRIALRLPASVARQDGAARVNRIQLYGMNDEALANLHTGQVTFPGDTARSWPRDQILLNSTLAAQLGVKVGDELVIRIPKPSALSGDSAIATRADATVALRLRVAGVATGTFANLNLNATARAPLNAFMQIADLGVAIGREGAANLILASPASIVRPMNRWDYFKSAAVWSRVDNRPGPFWNFSWVTAKGGKVGQLVDDAATIAAATPLLNQAFTLADADLNLVTHQRLPDTVSHEVGEPFIELKTPRIFLDAAVIRTAVAAETNAQRILTYLATLLSAGTNATPYSMVTAAGVPWTPADLRDDEIVLSQWLADDLQVKAGDAIALSYFLPESGARLEEATNVFRVHSIVPMELPWADRTLMPDFPGIEKAESTSEWDAGFPLTYEIRKKDDDYWKQRRGTPKAFITLAAGQKLWGNRFGELTAVRFPVPTNVTVKVYQAGLAKQIRANLKPEQLGLQFTPVRDRAFKAASESQDFGGLFLGFSFFLILAALLLMAMLFQFGLEQRASEIGTLLALGFTPQQVRHLFLREGVALAFSGGVVGAVGGIYYAKGMLQGLSTIWRDAVGATHLSFYFTAQTLVIGVLASGVVSTITIWLALRKFVKRSPRELLAGEIEPEKSKAQSCRARVVAFGAFYAALGLVGWTLATGQTANAGAFFGAGALVLVAGLSFMSAWLTKMEREAPASPAGKQPAELELRAPFTTLALAVRGCARRRKRSLTTVAMLACGSFLIVSIGVFRLDANRDATKRDSGTGGFALIGETTLPVVQDLNAESGRDFFALNAADLQGVNFVPFRVRAGDEASCLNLNRAQKPRLLGVKPATLAGRFSFTKLADGALENKPWLTLERGALYPKHDQPLAKDEVAAIGDANSIQWAMGKKVGDTMDYVDERGQPFKVRIVGAVANSILQGQLLIDEAEFVKRFPGESGYRTFLIDAPSNRVAQVSATLSRALQDVGLELVPAAQRLAEFNAVQNTYLGTFQVLGGLGLLLGSVGLGIVVLRNVLERRSELAVLMAVGFRKRQVQRLLFVENGALLLVGLGIGVGAAVIAVLPAVLSPGAQLPGLSLALTLGAVLLNGSLWTWAATRYAVRGDLLAALRND